MGKRKRRLSKTQLVSSYVDRLYFTSTQGRRHVHVNTAASINTEKTCSHPTTDSALRPTVLMVVNIFHSSTNGPDGCCTNIINLEVGSRCPEVGRRRRPSTTATLGRTRRPPTTVHVRERERQGLRSQHRKTPVLRNKNLSEIFLRGRGLPAGGEAGARRAQDTVASVYAWPRKPGRRPAKLSKVPSAKRRTSWSF